MKNVMILAWKQKSAPGNGNSVLSSSEISSLAGVEMDFLKCKDGQPISKYRRVRFSPQFSDPRLGDFRVVGFSYYVVRNNWDKVEETGFEEMLVKIDKVLERHFSGMNIQEYLQAGFQFSATGVEDFYYKLEVKSLLNLK